MKCWNSSFHARRGLRVIIVVVQVRAMKIQYVAAVGAALRNKERRHVKFQFDAFSCRNWLFSLPNRLTLQITLMLLDLLTLGGSGFKQKLQNVWKSKTPAVAVFDEFCVQSFFMTRRHLDDLHLDHGCVVFHFVSDTREKEIVD